MLRYSHLSSSTEPALASGQYHDGTLSTAIRLFGFYHYAEIQLLSVLIVGYYSVNGTWDKALHMSSHSTYRMSIILPGGNRNDTRLRNWLLLDSDLQDSIG
jgi:hypothetical protein